MEVIDVCVQFDERRYLNCPTQACLTKCQHMNIDRDNAREEISKIARGKDAFVLHDCVTCYPCEEYCPMKNHPFYMIVERQEELNVSPLPLPLIQRGINMVVPFRGETVIEEVNGRALLMGALFFFVSFFLYFVVSNVQLPSTASVFLSTSALRLGLGQTCPEVFL